jgi:TPR repeat protein
MDKAQGEWPYKTPIAIYPPAKKPLLAIAMWVAFGVLAMLKGDDVMDYFGARYARNVIRPQMVQLASEGKPDAIAWMVLNDSEFRSESQYAMLKAAADKGHAQSMYLYGKLLMARNDERGAHDYIARAAVAGNSSAVAEQSDSWIFKRGDNWLK